MTATREDLIGKLSDTMDPDNARAFVDEVIAAEFARRPMELLIVLKELVAAVKRDDNPGCEGLSSDSDEMQAARAVLKKQQGWTCKARASSTDPPQDCDWPTCGCDPYADKVIETLMETGVTLVTRVD